MADVVDHAYAKRVIDAHATLIAHDGRGAGHCENPWHKRGCADDPSLFGVFFKQCDPAHRPGASCSGAVLASPNASWSLMHGHFSRARGRNARKEARHAGSALPMRQFPAIERLIASQVKNGSGSGSIVGGRRRKRKGAKANVRPDVVKA